MTGQRRWLLLIIIDQWEETLAEGVWQVVINAQVCGYAAAAFHVNSLLLTIKSRIFALFRFSRYQTVTSSDQTLRDPSINEHLEGWGKHLRP